MYEHDHTNAPIDSNDGEFTAMEVDFGSGGRRN